VGVVLMKLLCDSCRIDVRRPGGATKSVPAFWHKLELGHDGSARGGLAAGCAAGAQLARPARLPACLLPRLCRGRRAGAAGEQCSPFMRR
jgi:hypothetical protein